MTREIFEKTVAQVIDELPEDFLKKLENVVILTEDEPSDEQREKSALEHDEDLLGLYEGVPQPERGGNYSLALPDRITLFKDAIEEEAEESGLDIKEVIRETLWHEITHHFGLDEDEAQESEKRRHKKYDRHF